MSWSTATAKGARLPSPSLAAKLVTGDVVAMKFLKALNLNGMFKSLVKGMGEL